MKPRDRGFAEYIKKGHDTQQCRGPFVVWRLGRMIGRQRKAILALQHRDLWQVAGLFSQVAANRADDPRQLIGSVQLLVRNRALDLLAFAVAQGQQDTAVRTWLSGDVVLGKYRSELILDQAHVYQLRWLKLASME